MSRHNFLCLLLLVIISCACGRKDSNTVWDTNKNAMRQLLGEIDQIRFDGKADNIVDALKIIKEKNQTALQMYGSQQTYLFNPNWADYTNAASNILAVTPMPLNHNGTNCFLGVNGSLQDVEMERVPTWGNETH